MPKKIILELDIDELQTILLGVHDYVRHYGSLMRQNPTGEKGWATRGDSKICQQNYAKDKVLLARIKSAKSEYMRKEYGCA